MAKVSYTLEDALAHNATRQEELKQHGAERGRRMQRAYDLESAAALAEQREDERNWGKNAVQGAALGASFGGPYGALIGGIAGTALGQARAVKSQLDEEGSGWDKTKRVANQLFGWGAVKPLTQPETFTGVANLGGRAPRKPLFNTNSSGMGGGYQPVGSSISDRDMEIAGLDTGDEDILGDEGDWARYTDPETSELASAEGAAEDEAGTGLGLTEDEFERRFGGG